MKKTICIIFMLVLMLCFSGAALAENYVYSASVDGEISLYISPDEDSYEITEIPACSRLELLETERTWGLVKFRNKAGWINLSFSRKDYSKAAEATGNDSLKNVKVSSKNSSAVLYSVPSENEVLGSKEKYQVPNGTVLKITRETQSGWGLVSMNGKYAWIKMEETIPHTEETDVDQYGIYYVYVLSDGGKGLELWETETGENLCGVVPDCVKLTVREEKGNYAYVSHNGINGWIDLNYTTESLLNAQMNAGTEVNVECKVTPIDGGDSVNMLSVPSENAGDGGEIVASLEKDKAVFVLRTTLSGWSLIYYDGNLGWLPPESVSMSDGSEELDINIYETPEVVYVATSQGKGLKLFSNCDGNKTTATIPEATQIKIIAEKQGYKYVSCDYAAGWVKDVFAEATYEEALGKYHTDIKKVYITERETTLMSLPTNNELCGSEALIVVPEGKYFEVLRTVTTAGKKWALTEIDGKQGWIKMSHTGATEVPVVLILVTSILVLAVIVVIMVIVVKIIRKKRKAKKEKGENTEVSNEKDDKKEDVSGVL